VARSSPRGQIEGRVLLVEDEPQVRRAYSRLLERSGFWVEALADGAAVLDQLSQDVFEVLVTDIALPGADGLEILRAVHERDPDLPVVLVTGSGNLESAVEALKLGALRYLLKPVEPAVLVQTVREAVRLRRIAQVERRAFELYGSATREASERTLLATRFTRALDGLRMAYQPIVSWSQRRVAAYEALVRTSEDSLGRPDLLFSAAEKLDRLHDLGRAIRASVARTIQETEVPVSVFMNLHPLDLRDAELYAADAPLSRVARGVVLEITERASLEEIRDLADRLGELRGLGFRLAVDDLGAGYAGLSSFAQVHPDAVKLDMSLVRGLDRDGTKQKLVRSMSDLCRDLHMIVIGEGVETPSERDALAAMGCDLHQGYLFARPGPTFPTVAWGAPKAIPDLPAERLAAATVRASRAPAP
jgi:EAL domain-containing protein (putative c-di-GMP-specific phosphodiesterase class I)